MANSAYKILNFGSLNYDYVYSLDHIVKPGETISSSAFQVFCGGKGLNQSVALARAGASVYHAGLVGNDGDMLLAACDESGVNRQYVRRCDTKTGHAMIQVDSAGQNSIVLFGGANQRNSCEYVRKVFSEFCEGDYLLLQNEVNLLNFMIEEAYSKKMKIILNPSPFDDKVRKCDLNKISIFIMNEVEGAQITGKESPDGILDEMIKRYPNARVVLTLGKEGVIYRDANHQYTHGIYEVEVSDTTAAGDTFTGFFLASIFNDGEIREALHIASAASSIAVSRKGAMSSIPCKRDVDEFRLKS